MSDAIANFLHTLVASGRHGGRTIRTDESTVVLYDCGRWSDAHSDAICARFPCTDVSILPSHSSLSGFIVVVRSCRDAAVVTWVLATLLLMAALFASGRHLLAQG
jgi:hypothetical protein